MTEHAGPPADTQLPRGSARRSRRSRGAGARLDVALLAAMAIAVGIVFLIPTFRHDRLFAVGPDVPVYLWWTRVGMAQGIPLVGERPGAPVLIGTVSGALGLGLVPALAGLQYALGPAIAAAGAGLLRGRGSLPRPVWFAGGLLAGIWATNLGDGYVSNLAFAAPFLAAAAALARRRRRGTAGATLLLGGGGLLHPQFFAVGAAVLLVSAGGAAIRERRLTIRHGDAGRVLAALTGGALIVGAGLTAALAGPARLLGDTSKDAYLRRTGQPGLLRRVYLSRFHDSWRRYAPIMNGILTLGGATHARGYAQRFLVSWVAVTAVAVPIAALTGKFPPDRLLTFAFCIPLLAAVGLRWLGLKLRRRALAYPVAVVLVVLTALPTLKGWVGMDTVISPAELRGATLAGRIASTAPPGTPLVFVAYDPTATGLFLASHAQNVARAAVPPDRAGDVYVFLGAVTDLLAGRPSVRDGDPQFGRASAESWSSIPKDRPSLVFVVQGFDQVGAAFDQPGLTRWDRTMASTAPDPRPLPSGPGELSPSSPERIAGATISTLALLLLVGFGWSWWAFGDMGGAAAGAAAFGVAALAISGLILERLGLNVGGTVGGTLAAALGGGSGYAFALLRALQERRGGRGRGVVLERQPGLDA